MILVQDHESGLKVVKAIEDWDAKFRPISHVFGNGGPNGEESRRRKHGFWRGKGALKACTIHSFKGWELNNVILIWQGQSRCNNDSNPWADLYVALSRSTESLFVFNTAREFDIVKSWITGIGRDGEI